MPPDPSTTDTLRKNALGVPHIVFFVIAAAAPLTAVVGVTPAAFMLGNGPGVPVTFILVGLLYLVFSIGFTAMSGHVLSAGGFYAYIKAGLGPAFGVAGALIALVTYTSVAVALYGLFGFFLNDLVTAERRARHPVVDLRPRSWRPPSSPAARAASNSAAGCWAAA